MCQRMEGVTTVVQPYRCDTLELPVVQTQVDWTCAPPSRFAVTIFTPPGKVTTRHTAIAVANAKTRGPRPSDFNTVPSRLRPNAMRH